ncbi:uncharacterized protein BJX67DRAFT_380598 [Aspergillus lucknowensis]|uniref:Uncharacterized protein n=1 Tax=Aspergillus lucknowensis TaxID=176173 RepID=A0ABR4LTD6_9EURO
MPFSNARPALQRSLATSSRPFSIAIPARLANESRLPPKPRGFLAEKGRFPFRERIPSYESIHSSASASALTRGAASGELEMLRRKTVEQRGKIEASQRAMGTTPAIPTRINAFPVTYEELKHSRHRGRISTDRACIVIKRVFLNAFESYAVIFGPFWFRRMREEERHHVSVSSGGCLGQRRGVPKYLTGISVRFDKQLAHFYAPLGRDTC